MAGQFRVEPDHLGGVSASVGELGSHASSVMSAAQTQIAAMGPCWGDGVLGAQFADGPNGFASQLARVAASVHAKAKLLIDCASQLTYAAAISQRRDQL